MPVNRAKLAEEVNDLGAAYRSYAKLQEQFGNKPDPELTKRVLAAMNQMEDAFGKGDLKAYREGKREVEQAYKDFNVGAPSLEGSLREAAKVWKKYEQAQALNKEPVKPEYVSLLNEAVNELKGADQMRDVDGYVRAQRKLRNVLLEIQPGEGQPTVGDKVLTFRAAAHFFNGKFVARNILSQPFMWLGDKTDNAVAATLSKAASLMTKKPPAVGLDQATAWQAMVQGAKDSVAQRVIGKSIDPLYGLHPHAFGETGAVNRMGRAVEDGLFLVNRLPDDAFYNGYLVTKLNELYKTYGKRADVSLAIS